MKDSFSKQAIVYSKYRPVYPQVLFDCINSVVAHKKLAWDCGTGNGQTAKELSKYFEQVYATDISAKQIENASTADNITYALEPAEQTSLKDNSVNLITVSQALHWFNFTAFYDEVKRVSTPGAVIAVWAYSLLKITPVVDKIIEHYHFEILKDYWDTERKYVDDGYANIPFPFTQINHPSFEISVNWTLQDLEGYLTTWSALQNFITANNFNPVPALIEKIKAYWQPETSLPVVFPIHLKIGYVH
ncbi:MAG: class I SAM-dependent methyltransferase [Ferruginibacter sp.]